MYNGKDRKSLECEALRDCSKKGLVNWNEALTFLMWESVIIHQTTFLPQMSNAFIALCNIFSHMYCSDERKMRPYGEIFYIGDLKLEGKGAVVGVMS